VGDGVAVPGRRHIFWKLASVEKGLAVAGVEFVQDDELDGRLENLLTFREGPGPRVADLPLGGRAPIMRDIRRNSLLFTFLEACLNRIAAVKRLKGQYRARFVQEARVIGAPNNRVRNIGPAATLFTADDPANRLRS
jgi:hypothetical protein